MIYYAIVRKVDGAFMPQGRGRGFTHDMPTLEKPPRLFTTRGAANRALDCWLLGDWIEVSSDSLDYGVYPEPPPVRPADRKREDMGVVLVRVEVPSTPVSQ